MVFDLIWSWLIVWLSGSSFTRGSSFSSGSLFSRGSSFSSGSMLRVGLCIWRGSSFCRSSFSGSSLLILPFYTCQLFYIYRCDIFILRVPRFFVGSDNIRSCPKTSQRLPKTLRSVPSNMNTGTQRKIDFPTKKKRIRRKLIIHIDFSFLSLVLVSLNN